MKKNKLLIRIFIAMGLLLAAAAIAAAIVITRKIQLCPPSLQRYPVQGVDVSHYQGEIDWQVLSGQSIRFAFIKATEGSSHVDERFSYNWDSVKKTTLAAGAYHFFSFDSPGLSQAQNYIDTVGSLDGMLPPVVDFEFYGDKKINRPDEEEARNELTNMLDALEAEYGRKPVIYATLSAYQGYLKGYFEEYPLWIRNIYTSPELVGISGWAFWQYSDTEKLAGYEGAEGSIDKNVFWGNEEEWKAWLDNKTVFCPVSFDRIKVHR